MTAIRVERGSIGMVDGGERAGRAVDRERVARWAEAYRLPLYGWALRLTRDRAEAEDVVQGTFVAALERLDAEVPVASERAWLFGIARRLALRAIRARRGLVARLLGGLARAAGGARGREAGPLGGVAARLRQGGGGEEAAAGFLEEERRALVAAEIERLPARQREVLFLVFHEGMTVEEAAHVMEISPGAGRRHYHRAKEALRAALGRNGAFEA